MAKLTGCIVAAATLQAAQAYVVPNSAAPRAAVSPAVTYAEPQVFEQTFVQEEAAASSSWSPLAFGAALGLAAAVMTANAPAASAADIENGQAIFGANCTACHAGGNGMPAFGERLGPDDIEDVANYVRGQADK